MKNPLFNKKANGWNLCDPTGDNNPNQKSREGLNKTLEHCKVDRDAEKLQVKVAGRGGWNRISVSTVESDDKRFTITVIDPTRRYKWFLLKDYETGKSYECPTKTDAKEKAKAIRDSENGEPKQEQPTPEPQPEQSVPVGTHRSSLDNGIGDLKKLGWYEVEGGFRHAEHGALAVKRTGEWQLQQQGKVVTHGKTASSMKNAAHLLAGEVADEHRPFDSKLAFGRAPENPEFDELRGIVKRFPEAKFRQYTPVGDEDYDVPTKGGRVLLRIYKKILEAKWAVWELRQRITHGNDVMSLFIWLNQNVVKGTIVRASEDQPLIGQILVNGFRYNFTGDDVVNPDEYIPEGQFNPHHMRPWAITLDRTILAIVYAQTLQDALDEAADSGKLEVCLLEGSDLLDRMEGEGENIDYLGNASDPYDLSYVHTYELPNKQYGVSPLALDEMTDGMSKDVEQEYDKNFLHSLGIKGSKKAALASRGAYPTHWAIADALGTEVETCSVGAYIPVREGRLWLVEPGNDELPGVEEPWEWVVIMNEQTGQRSRPFHQDSDAEAIEAARSLLDNPPPSPKKKTPRFNEKDKNWLKEMGIKGSMKNPLLHAAAEDTSPYDDIQDPFCLCKHKFLDHESGIHCDHCDCNGFTPVSMDKQVEMWCERRAFGRVGKKSNPMMFERGKGDRMMKVYFNGNRIGKVEFQEHKTDKPETREGWDGFWSIIQTYGD